MRRKPKMINDNIWLMEPERHRNMLESRTAMMADPEFMAKMAAYDGQEPKPYAMKNRVALISFDGTISTRDSFFSWLMGGAVLPALADQVKAADADNDVDGIVLVMNTPGGPPAGLAEFSNMLRGIDTPIVGFCDGMVASGGMWIASALDGLVVSKTASVGSIGVIAVLEDITKLAANEGVKFTVLRAGKYKALGIRYESLTKEGKDVLQAEIDALYSVFIDELAFNMNKEPEEILKVAEGKIFIGQQAVEAGLADRIGFLDDAVDMALNNNELTGGTEMPKDIKSVKALQKAYPELCTELLGTVDFSEQVSAAETAENTRLLDLVSAFFGDKDGVTFKAVVDSGVTLEQYNSIKATIPVPKAETVAPAPDSHEAKAVKLAALENESSDVTKLDADAGTGPADFEAAWKLVKEELKCDTQKAMSVAVKRYPELHEKITGGGK
ncbi:MAG: S49 family peptidase [Planctomycetes bacterium]|nr:S49 family peptidase [Planctomycetota bacterium]